MSYFVEAELAVPMPLAVAKEALDRGVADSGLVAESRRGVDEGLVFLMRCDLEVVTARPRMYWPGSCQPVWLMTGTCCRSAGRSRARLDGSASTWVMPTRS